MNFSSTAYKGIFTVLLTSLAFASQASLSGTYSINPSGTASASVYLSLTSAISDLTLGTRADGGTPNGSGVSGAIIFELASGYTSSGETFPLTFGAISGLSSSNTITVRPAAAVSSVLTITSSNTTATIDLGGVNYLIIDGRPGGAGSNKYITINNSSTSGVALRFINDASNNTIQYCTLSGVNNSVTGGVVVFSTTTGTTGNDNNTIDNCNIRDGSTTPANGIYSAGTASKENSGNTVSNCNVYNFFAAGLASMGINIGSNNDSWTVTGNSLYQTASRTATAANTHRAISVASGNSHIISNNYIGGGAASTGGTAWTITGSFSNRFIGIDLGVGTTIATSVQNNTIANFNWSSNGNPSTLNGIFCAINITSGNVNIGTTTGNTIGNASTGSITVTISLSGGASNLINCSSAGTVVISNNTISSVTATGTTTSISSGINGILLSGSGNITVSGNTIGSTSVSNSLNASNASTDGATQILSGISSSASGTVNITNNTIANLNSNYAGTSTNGMKGISISNGANTITGNTIYNLSNASVSSGTDNNAAIIGINFFNANSNNQLISQNIIHSLSSTASSAGVSVTGLFAGGANTGSHVISRNFIHSLTVSSSSTSCIITGIEVYGGSGITFQNNMIRLGIDASGNSITTGCAIYGILQLLGSSINFYHNSVYIGGTGVSSSANTIAFYRSQTSTPVNLVNNILVNARSNSSGTAVNKTIHINATTDYSVGYMISNNNLLYAPGTGGVIGTVVSTDYASLSLWQAATGFDMGSGAGNPGFVNVTGSASAVDLHVTGTTPVEGSGSAATGITDDYDGSTRSSFTAVDIGADAGNFTASDIFSPVFSYTKLFATASTGNRSITVNISDIGTGVPTSGGNRPRMWFRRLSPSSSAWSSVAGTLNSGSANNGSWTFVIDYSQLSITPTNGETYQYYFVAQDQAGSPNLGYSPLAGAAHTDVNTQTSAPTTPNSYAIVSALSTTISVGTGQTYTSLTGSGGLFAAINSAVLGGNTTVSVVSDLSEDGTNALNSQGMGGYTLTIAPGSATIRVISNSSSLSQPMIRIDGASGVTFDGRFSGSGQYLRIVNTHTTNTSCYPAIQFQNGATGNTLQNCILESNSYGGTAKATVEMGAGANSLTIKGCDLRDAQGTPGTVGRPYGAIYSGSTTNSITIGGSTAADGNNIYNFSTIGVNLAIVADGVIIRYNNFYQNNGALSTITCISIAYGNNHTVSNNNMYRISGTLSSFTGIQITGWGSGHTISNNSIGGSNASRGGAALTLPNSSGTLNGIYLTAGTASYSNIQGNLFSNFGDSLAGNPVFAIQVTAGHVNIGTSSGNIIGGLATASDTITNGADNSLIYYTGTNTVDIENNTIGNVAYYRASGDRTAGIGIAGACTAIIKNNIIRDIKSNSTGTTTSAFSCWGIFINAAITATSNIEGNTIYNIENTNTGTTAVLAAGIRITTALTTGATMQRNKIYNIKANGTGTGANAPVVAGISITQGANAVTISNNEITVGGGAGADIKAMGINDNSTAANNYYYNSIYVTGSMSSGTNNSYCVYRSGASGSTNMRNNLFYNDRTGSTGKMYAVGATSAILGASNLNYNLAIVPDTAKLVEMPTSTANGWGAINALFAGSVNSNVVELTTNVAASNLFNNTSSYDLDIKASNVACWYANGRGVQISGVTADYGSASAARSATVSGGGTDIGADEFTPSVNAPDVTVSGSHSNSGTETLTFAGRTVATITWGGSGTLPTLSSYKYWPGTNPNDVTNNGTTNSATYTNAYWAINVTGGSGYTYDLNLYYDDALLGSIASETNMRLAKKQTGVNGTWTMPSSSVNTTTNILTASSLTSFSEFAGTEVATPLPVEFISFTGQKVFGNAQLNWSTASERNNKEFEVERSANAKDFETVGVVGARGNSSSVNNYKFTHINPFAQSSTVYYRLKQVDYNGDHTYSNVISLSNETNKGVTIQAINPNPFTAQLNITLGNLGEGTLQVEVLSMDGKQLYSHSQTTGSGSQHIDLSQLNNLPEGVYILSVTNGNNNMRQKLVKLR